MQKKEETQRIKLLKEKTKKKKKIFRPALASFLAALQPVEPFHRFSFHLLTKLAALFSALRVC